MIMMTMVMIDSFSKAGHQWHDIDSKGRSTGKIN